MKAHLTLLALLAFMAFPLKSQDYQILDIAFSESPDSRLQIGTRVTYTIVLQKPDEDCYIHAVPVFDNTPGMDTLYSRGETFPGTTATLNGWFYFPGFGQVDAIQIYFIDPKNSGNILHRLIYPIEFTWGPFRIFDISVYPGTPSDNPVRQNVFVDFTFEKSPGDSVKIILFPMNRGDITPGVQIHDSPIVSEAFGMTSRSFKVLEEGFINSIEIRITSWFSDQIVFYRKIVPVQMWFIPYSIHRLEFSQSDGSVLEPGTYINIDAEYFMQSKVARLVLMPRFQEKPLDDAILVPTGVLSDSTGKASVSFTLASEGEVDQIDFSLVDPDNDKTIYCTTSRKVSYRFAKSSSADKDPGASAQVYPTLAREYLQIKCFPAGTTEVEIFSGSGQIVGKHNLEPGIETLSIGHLKPGSYIVRLRSHDSMKAFTIFKQ